MNLLYTASAVEVAVVIIGIIGQVVSVINALGAWGDRKVVLREGKNGSTKRTATWVMVEEMLRGTMLALFMAAGVVAGLAPPSANQQTRASAIVVLTLLLAVELLLLAGSVWSMYNRVRLVEDYEQEELMRVHRGYTSTGQRGTPPEGEVTDGIT